MTGDLHRLRRHLDQRARDNDAVMADVLRDAVEMLAATTGMRQWTVNRRADSSFVVLSASVIETGLKVGDRLPWSQTLCALMTDGRGPRIAGSLLDTVYAHAASPQVQAYMGEPLQDETGRVIGSISGIDGRRRDDLHLFTPVVEATARHVGHLLAVSTLRDDFARALNVATRELATDALTGLLTRRAWNAAVMAEQDRVDRHGTQAGILVIDVDQLKTTNDTNGHLSGDQVLRTVARAIASSIPTPSVAARIGGDEFAVLIGDVTAADLDVVGRGLEAALATAAARASVGAAVTTAGDVTAAIAAADADMYRAKNRRSTTHVGDGAPSRP